MADNEQRARPAMVRGLGYLRGYRADTAGALVSLLAVSVANLSYLIPSSPGAIGTFEFAVKSGLMSHGASESQSALFGLALHAWLLISVTGAGGLIFLLHRAKRPEHKPLLEEFETLPAELP